MKIRALQDKIGDFFISWRMFERLPTFLRFFTGTSLGCAIFFPVLAVLPAENITMNGELITYEELWKRGDALVFMIAGPVLLAISYGVLGRRSWVRPYIVIFPVIQVLITGIIFQIFEHPTILRFQNPLEYLGNILLVQSIYIFFWGTFFLWYLYYKKTVVAYFNGEISVSESH